MPDEAKTDDRSGVDRGLIAVGIDFRGHTLRVLDLKTLIELKKTSKDPKDKQRLPVLKETLRQLEKECGRGENEEDNDK